MLRSTLTTFVTKGNTNGRGVMFLPQGSGNTAGIKWYEDQVHPFVLDFRTEYEFELKLVDQKLWDEIVAKYSADGTLKGVDLTGCFFFDIHFRNLTCDHVIFKGCRFSACAYEHITFESCNLNNATVCDSFRNCKFIDCSFMESHICQAHFYECSLTDCDFTSAVMRHCLFYDSTLDNNNFLSVRMDSVFIRGCNCYRNANTESISITMGGATSEEVSTHSLSIMHAITA